jgi:hypothetical protein
LPSSYSWGIHVRACDLATKKLCPFTSCEGLIVSSIYQSLALDFDIKQQLSVLGLIIIIAPPFRKRLSINVYTELLLVKAGNCDIFASLVVEIAILRK